MAQIVINEISQNYSFNIGTNSYAAVAMPITSCWGPGYFDPDTYYQAELKCENKTDYMLEHTAWTRFPATQAGLEAFVSTYRGPSSVYRRAKDYSYQMAVTLLTSGYDVLACRLCPGSQAQGVLNPLTDTGIDESKTLVFAAKYPGTFGNNIQVAIRKGSYYDATLREKRPVWNILTNVIDASGVKTTVENLSCVFDLSNATDSVLHYTEVESNFWMISVDGVDSDDIPGFGHQLDPEVDTFVPYVQLTGGSDTAAIESDAGKIVAEIKRQIEPRINWAKDYNLNTSDTDASMYNKYLEYTSVLPLSIDTLNMISYREWLYTALVCGSPTSESSQIGRTDGVLGVMDLLKDKLAYNPNRLIASGWDDQNYLFALQPDVAISYLMGDEVCEETCMLPPSPLHLKLMDVAYYSRCATALIDIPHIVDRKYVHIEDETNWNRQGYTQKLARVLPVNAEFDVNGSLFHTHSALFAPWAQYTYVGTARMNEAAPAFLALMIQRAQILNQAIQYEWALPTNRKHKLKIGKLSYNVPKKLLDKWQKLDGASLNIITTIPDLGTNLWGNSTLFEVPPATYQALANLSTRYLVNAVEDVVYRVGIGITFQYNNGQAYNKFYAGVTPLLDTMKNVGAIDDYYVQMSADIDQLDQVNANTVIGKIYLVVNGVINDIYVDLICLPPGTDLNQYRI